MMFIDVETHKVYTSDDCGNFDYSNLVDVPKGTELIIQDNNECIYFLKDVNGVWFLAEEDYDDCWCSIGFNPYNEDLKIIWEERGFMPNTSIDVDVVNHPKHYTSDGCGVEAIEITSLLPCCISNALKYVWRCGKKDDDLQELKKAEWYLEYSISNNLPSTISGLSDTLDFENLINKVKESWVGDKYMFIDALYWGNQELMLKAVKSIIESVVESIENSKSGNSSVNTVSGLSKIGESK